MKNFILAIICFLICITCKAQAWAMHEIAEEGGGNLSDLIKFFASIFNYVLYIAIALVIYVTFIDDIKTKRHSKKYKKRQSILRKEALGTLSDYKFKEPYRRISTNECFRDWYIKGYIDGVDNGRERIYSEPYKTGYKKIGIDEYITTIRFEFYSKESLGGDIEFSKESFKQGILDGALRRETKGDSRDMLE